MTRWQSSPRPARPRLAAPCGSLRPAKRKSSSRAAVVCAVPLLTTVENCASLRNPHTTSYVVVGIPPGAPVDSGSSAGRVHSTTRSVSGSPEATPRVKGSPVAAVAARRTPTGPARPEHRLRDALIVCGARRPSAHRRRDLPGRCARRRTGTSRGRRTMRRCWRRTSCSGHCPRRPTALLHRRRFQLPAQSLPSRSGSADAPANAAHQVTHPIPVIEGSSPAPTLPRHPNRLIGHRGCQSATGGDILSVAPALAHSAHGDTHPRTGWTHCRRGCTLPSSSFHDHWWGAGPAVCPPLPRCQLSAPA